MATKHVAFDIETTEVDLEHVSASDITVAATVLSDGECLCWATWIEGDFSYTVPSCPCRKKDIQDILHSSEFSEGKEAEARAEPATVATPRLSDAGVVALYEYLEDKVRSGYVISTWNGAGFDFQILHAMLKRAERSDLAERCIQLAHGASHLDIMFAFFANKGFAVSLGKVAQAMLGNDATKSMDGGDAPLAWRENGRRQIDVALYCANDVALQSAIHTAVLKQGRVSWRSRADNLCHWSAKSEMKHAVRLWKAFNKRPKKRARGGEAGEAAHVDVYKGENYASLDEFLSVKASAVRPLPDVQWMQRIEGMEPWHRDKFLKWSL